MIVTEIIKQQYSDGTEKEFLRTYSSLGFLVECNGVRYSEAVDLIDTDRVYVETDEYILGLDENANEEDYLNALSKLGVE